MVHPRPRLSSTPACGTARPIQQSTNSIPISTRRSRSTPLSPLFPSRQCLLRIDRSDARSDALFVPQVPRTYGSKADCGNLSVHAMVEYTDCLSFTHGLSFATTSVGRPSGCCGGCCRLLSSVATAVFPAGRRRRRARMRVECSIEGDAELWQNLHEEVIAEPVPCREGRDRGGCIARDLHLARCMD